MIYQVLVGGGNRRLRDRRRGVAVLPVAVYWSCAGHHGTVSSRSTSRPRRSSKESASDVSGVKLFGEGVSHTDELKGVQFIEGGMVKHGMCISLGKLI